MSVAVVITFRNEDTTGPTYLPVATEEIFAAYWLPAAARLGLVWMPLFQSGTTVAIEDFPSVRAEFEQMRDHFARAPEDAAPDYLNKGARPQITSVPKIPFGMSRCGRWTRMGRCG